MDFGLDKSEEHLRDPESGHGGCHRHALDRVMGNGEAITRLVSFADPESPSCPVKFTTVYDDGRLAWIDIDDHEKKIMADLLYFCRWELPPSDTIEPPLVPDCTPPLSISNPEKTGSDDFMPNDNAPDRSRSSDSPADNSPSNQRAEQNACPYCTEMMVSIDMHRGREFQSKTLKCETCEECFLHVRRGDASTLIHLPDFLQRRGDDLEKRPLHDRGMSEHLVHAMVCDIWPSPATTVDFGLDSTDHYAAMQAHSPRRHYFLRTRPRPR